MAVELTEQQISEYREAFSLFDKDGNGHISSNELAEVMNSLGQSIEEEELQGIIAEVDEDKNGEIEWDEFLAIMSQRATPESATEELREAFNLFDKDFDGIISASELRRVMIFLGEKLSDSEIEEMIRIADVNKDGKITFDDFVTLLNQD